MSNTGRADYYDRRAARLARLDDRAKTLGSEASSLWQRASAMADRIPMGQPILVGHHSEKRDRGYRARIQRTFERAHETQQAAKDAARRAARPSHAISSDAPDALELLRDKAGKLAAERDRFKAINKAVRLKDVVKGDAAMRALGLSDVQAANMRKPDFAGRIGVPDYCLANIGAQIRQVAARIAILEREAASAPAPAREVAPGVSVVEDTDANRIQIVFPGKPDDATRSLLKSHGFRWAPSEGAWQRLLNDAGRLAAARIAAQIGRSE